MSITSDIRAFFEQWVAAVSAAAEAVIGRLLPRRQIVLTEGRAGDCTITAASTRQGGDLPATSFRVVNGQPSPSLPEEWLAALRSSNIELRLNPDQVLLRPVEFPRQAADFLDGMIRAQIDRLTPWSAQEAVFGWSEPKLAAGDRIHVTLAATSRRTIEPPVTLAQHLGARAVTGMVELPLDDGQLARIKVFDLPIQRLAGPAIDIPRALRFGMLGAGMIAAVSLAVAIYLTSALDQERQQLQSQIAARRAALRLSQNGAAGSAQAVLVQRKQTIPATVMVLDSISKVLPDGTYVTELRVDGDKVQIIGVTQEAPPLIRLIEQSPQFTQATFFAPTTRSPNEAGERFHIEAHLKPYFGSAS
jgi:general secretion pathway protein L